MFPLIVLVFVSQINGNEVFAELIARLDRLGSLHTSATKVAKSDVGKLAIEKKYNTQVAKIVSDAIFDDKTFEFEIRGITKKEDGKFELTLEPPESFSKQKSIKTRSLKISIEEGQGEHLFTDDLLQFTGRLKTGKQDRSKAAIPFASVHLPGLSVVALWIDDVELKESRPKSEVKKGKVNKSVEDVVSPEMVVIQIDRLFKTARQEVSQGKSTADKQDSANMHFKTIMDSLKILNGKAFLFETTIRDVWKNQTTRDVFAILDHSVEFSPFLQSKTRAPLLARESIHILIAEEDRAEFQIGRNLLVSGTLSVTAKTNDGQRECNLFWVEVDSYSIAKAVVPCDSAIIEFDLKNIQTEFVNEDSSQTIIKSKLQPNRLKK